MTKTQLELKIKNKHLSEESKIIRHEERKLIKQAKWLRENQAHRNSVDVENSYNSLHNHRKIDVRNEQRATFIARAFLENRAYESIEGSKPKDENAKAVFNFYIKPRALKIVNKYRKNMGVVHYTEFEEWLNPIKF